MLIYKHKKGVHEWDANIVFQIRELRVSSLYFIYTYHFIFNIKYYHNSSLDVCQRIYCNQAKGATSGLPVFVAILQPHGLIQLFYHPHGFLSVKLVCFHVIFRAFSAVFYTICTLYLTFFTFLLSWCYHGSIKYPVNILTISSSKS